jgi:hypothetical protein
VTGRGTPRTLPAVLKAALKALPGVLVALLGGWVLAGGYANLTDHDGDGFVMFDPATFERPSAAIVITNEPLGGEGRLGVLGGRLRCRANADGAVHRAIEDSDVDIRIQGVTRAPGPLFLGVAPAAAAEEYLADVARDRVARQGVGGAQCGERIDQVGYTHYEGPGLPAAPGAETIWQASVAGTDLVTLDFTIPTEGEWAVVVMNADGSPGITADLALGARLPGATGIGLSQAAVGFVAVLAGGLAVLAAVLRLRGLMIGLGLAVVGFGAVVSITGPPLYLALLIAALGLVVVVLGVKRARDVQRSQEHPPVEQALATDAPVP